MISLRLSDGEYEVLKTHYRAYGARSISDLARVALKRIVTMPASPQVDIASQLTELNDRVRMLESRVALLAEREKVVS
jgi:hypothetical protein